jgi:hypothetical protein
MKKIKLFLSVVLFTSFFNSCEDAYKIEQDGEFNEETITTVSGMQSYLNGIYAGVSIANEISFSTIFTDEAGVGRGSGGQNFTTHRFILNSNEPAAAGIWYGKYNTINLVNRLLVIATQVPVPTEPSQLATYNSILAQARALRAFSYFQLLTFFSTDMSDNNALGVILTTDVNEISDRLPRTNNGPCFELIESDLDYAFNNVVPNPVQHKYISKSMIDALRARMYLYRKNYPLAKQYASSTIDNYGISLTQSSAVPAGAAGTSSWNSSFYGGNTPNLYRRMWADLPVTSPPVRYEQIFSLDRPAAPATGWENIASVFTTNTTNISGSPLWEVGRTLFNKMSARPNDIRRYANVDPTSLINANYATDPNYLDTDVIVIDKYPGKTGAVLRNDVKVFRLSEMYLILAECYAHEGNLNGSAASTAWAIKQIRDARAFPVANNNTPLLSFANPTEAFSAIMDERHLELCFEGHRYIDIKRLGPLANRSIERDATDDIIQNVLTIPNNDVRFTLPIPQAEINANPSIQRNPSN